MPLSLTITIVIAAVCALATTGLFIRSRRIRTLAVGVGLVVLPVGVYLIGLTDLAVNGVRSLIDWAHRTSFDTAMVTGLWLAGAGLMLLVIGMLLPRRYALHPRPKQPKEVAPSPSKSAPASTEEAEIEEILRRRGIN